MWGWGGGKGGQPAVWRCQPACWRSRDWQSRERLAWGGSTGVACRRPTGAEERVAASGANWPGLVWSLHCHRELGGGVCGGRPGGGLEGLAGGGRAWRGGRRGRRGRQGRGRAAAGAARRRPGPETRVSVGVQVEKEWLGSISVSFSAGRSGPAPGRRLARRGGGGRPACWADERGWPGGGLGGGVCLRRWVS
jgi:hypothetical protein